MSLRGRILLGDKDSSGKRLQQKITDQINNIPVALAAAAAAAAEFGWRGFFFLFQDTDRAYMSFSFRHFFFFFRYSKLINNWNDSFILWKSFLYYKWVISSKFRRQKNEVKKINFFFSFFDPNFSFHTQNFLGCKAPWRDLLRLPASIFVFLNKKKNTLIIFLYILYLEVFFFFLSDLVKCIFSLERSESS